MDTFTAALDVLTHHGYSNALELANQIELTATNKPKRRNFDADKERLFEIMRQYYPTYCAGKKQILNEVGQTIGYREDRRPLTIEAVNSKSRMADLVLVRQIMMCLLQADYSCSTVGRSFGGRDHSTALHAKYTVNDQCDVNKAYRAKFEEIKKAYLS